MRQQLPLKFVVLGHPRCGSNLLVRALAEHPQVRMLGEVLGRDQRTRAEGWGWTQVKPQAWAGHPQPVYQDGEDAGRFLRQAVYGPPWTEGIKAGGFKLFYDHAQDPQGRKGWQYLAADRGVRVIHLVRRNLLDVLVSFEVALRSQRWIHVIEQGSEVGAATPPFPLPPERCSKYFEDVSTQRERAQKFFARHQILPIEYEGELSHDFHATALKAFRFLGLDEAAVRPGTIKQQRIPVSKQLLNFDELRLHFTGTQYETYFLRSGST